MKTVLHFISFIVKLILFIVFLPLILIAAAVKYAVFSAVLTAELMKNGLEYESARNIASEMSPVRLLKQ